MRLTIVALRRSALQSHGLRYDDGKADIVWRHDEGASAIWLWMELQSVQESISLMSAHHGI
jgi:hypothetical protein